MPNCLPPFNCYMLSILTGRTLTWLGRARRMTSIVSFTFRRRTRCPPSVDDISLVTRAAMKDPCFPTSTPSKSQPMPIALTRRTRPSARTITFSNDSRVIERQPKTIRTSFRNGAWWERDFWAVLMTSALEARVALSARSRVILVSAAAHYPVLLGTIYSKL